MKFLVSSSWLWPAYGAMAEGGMAGRRREAEALAAREG